MAEQHIPSYILRTIESKPTGSEGTTVEATNQGWVSVHKNGDVEVLEEIKNLRDILAHHGFDKNGEKIEPGAVLSTDLDIATLESLSVEDLKLLGGPLGITNVKKETLVKNIAEKLGLK